MTKRTITKAEREKRHVSRIRKMVQKSPGEIADLATTRHRADSLQTKTGDETLHDALDEVEREVTRHNANVYRGSAGGTAPRTMSDAQDRAVETRQRTAEHFKREKAQQLERKRGMTAVAPTSDNHPNKAQYGEGFNRVRKGRGFSG